MSLMGGNTVLHCSFVAKATQVRKLIAASVHVCDECIFIMYQNLEQKAQMT